MQFIKDVLLLDTVLKVESCSFPWKPLSGVLKPKKVDFPAKENTLITNQASQLRV